MKKQYNFEGAKRGAVLRASRKKTRITIRLDDDVLEWFREMAHRGGGGSYQTMINDALRAFVRAKGPESLEHTLRRVLREELPHAKKASSR